MAALTLGGIAANACSASGDPQGSGGGAATSASGTGSNTASGSNATGAGGTVDFDGGSSGTGGLSPDGACASVSSEATTGLAPADIIIAVDTSGSMSEEADQVQVNLNNFASIITGSGIDVHVILIADTSVCIPAPLGAGACPADENLPVYQHVQQGVSSTDALEVILNTYPLWQGSLRAGATKTFAVVTDDNSDMSASEFTNALLALDPAFAGFKFDAIAAPVGPAACTGCLLACASCAVTCCDKTSFCIPLPAAQGKVYEELVQQTGGVFGDLCSQNFDPVFQSMATSVVQGSTIACVYDIPAVPDGGVIDPNKVNVNYTPGGSSTPQTLGYVPNGPAGCGQNGGWYYDDPQNPAQILLCDLTCDAIQSDSGGKVEVLFGCDTIIATPE